MFWHSERNNGYKNDDNTEPITSCFPTKNNPKLKHIILIINTNIDKSNENKLLKIIDKPVDPPTAI